ncbi:MAG TPA: S8 family peptidase [Anaerolineales bacterium]|nr:S8 family peptidase [Anaerolineales bacterium]
MLSFFSKKNPAKYWCRSGFNLIVALSLVLMTFSASGTTIALAGNKVELKADPRLLQLATDHPTHIFKVIVQKDAKNKDSKVEDPQLAVEKGGGKIKKQLNLITSFSAELTGKEILKLAKNKKVRWISPDVRMVSTSVPNSTYLFNVPATENILDTFASNDFTSSEGTKNWSTPWIENDLDGSGETIGNIQIVGGTDCWDFTGNCLQLITRNIGDNVTRTADLSSASSATLTLWRNNQMTGTTNNNAVTLEVSTDGSNWTSLRTWRDNTEDIGAASESFDLTPYINSATQIRFSVSEREFDSNIYFDNIQIQYSTLQNIYPLAVGADKVWNEPLFLDGQGVTVAVVDSGFTDNVDFQVYGGGDSRVVASADVVGTPPNPTDEYGHGMHVAGILGGNGNFSNGARTGIAPGVNLVNVKVSNEYGMSYGSDLVKSLQWVYDNRLTYNIRVVNLSMNSTFAESYQTSPIDAAVEILWNAGIVVVVSAGNNGTTTMYPPANDPFAITVGAADDMGTPNISDDVMTSFSAAGITEDGFAKPDLVAPGRNILSLLAGTDAHIYTDHPANRVDTYLFRMSGTSMSAPVVSGAVALLLQNEPDLNPDQVKYRLMATANKDWNGYIAATAGAGYLDIYAAVQTETTAAANTGIQFSQLLSTSGDPIIWDSVGWESVGWESVGWESVGWESVGWESVGWESVGWESVGWESVGWESSIWDQ